MADAVYVVLFRGVGGDTKLPSAPLREALAAEGFRNVVTYIATGNVVLISELKPEDVREHVAKVSRDRLGFTKSVIVMTRREWSAAVGQNPFPDAAAEPRTLHAFICDGKPPPDAVATLSGRATSGERVAVKGRVLYLHTPNAFGTSKLPPLIERAVKVPTTARNWNTMLKLDDLARAAAASG
jgi:uncharacterized protein (DUF1697 family)